ncbi:AAA family ATPase [Metasolibacillus sp.]|uniref:AAA family ATPase n=1 Tax=Metasolibacillus sp. TaxID=2703680 RepID=UPI0025FDB543|nr:AAA family ATPase [Metasolibacillus sp.]MCT6922721.1 AAA family ATPase [Metasolibacillus sp.]MCT6938940.1 AAA family ATPase [Metasolibacillus sp.]
MKAMHLQSLLDAYRDLSESAFLQYTAQFDMEKMRTNELDDLNQLVEELTATGKPSLHHFFVGYKIKQISKEFDLLRIGKNYIVNIELKSESTKQRMRKQLQQNVYYLKFLEVDILSFTFVSSTKTLYQLKDDKLIKVSFLHLLKVLENQQIRLLTNIDDVFDPINYLVSPFELPHAFINGEYFLTSPQMTFKREILDLVEHNTSVVIDGAPGTGKTLLTYDLVKTWRKAGKRVVLVHGNVLNKGQRILNEQYGWTIQTVDVMSLANVDIVVIDEAQKLSYEQLQRIRAELLESKIPAVFSLDAGYYLFGEGHRIDVRGYIEKHFATKIYELKMVMRYNKEMQSFVHQLFDQRLVIEKQHFPNISVHYFSTEAAFTQHIEECKRTNWLVVDCYHFERPTTRDILGHEFNRVCVIIDNHFTYKANGRLSAAKKSATIDPLQVLYHTIIRTRKKLQLVIVDNVTILQAIINLLKNEH